MHLRKNFLPLAICVFVGAIGVGVLASPGTVSANGVIALSLGESHSCAVVTPGTTQCWGHNLFGRLGDGTVLDRTAPTAVLVAPGGALLEDVSAIAAGGEHTCALTSGEVKCWGRNASGQLGNNGTNNASSPVDVCADAGCATDLGDIIAITAGQAHTCALTNTGGVKCWGSNTSGQLGDGQTCGTTSCTTPITVSGLASGVTGISAGGAHTCALTDTTGVKCWGNNGDGQLGDGSQTLSLTPVDVCDDAVCAGTLTGIAAISSGRNHNCGVTMTNGLKCWGRNHFGQLGDGTALNFRAAPVEACASGAEGTCVLLTGVDGVDGGDAHTCAASTTNAGTCWGNNLDGQIGDGAACGILCPNPVAVTGLGSNAAAMTLGDRHSCVLTTSGGILCWGANSFGQLGDSTKSPRTTPAESLGLADPPDADSDGCLDTAEQQTGSGSEQTGGLRNPKYFWDFFDTPNPDLAAGPPNYQRDRVINILDILRVTTRFGANDTGNPPIDRTTDPLSAPPPAPAYHPAFDRGKVIGPNVWDKAPADGTINIPDDILGIALVFGHNCE